MISRFHPKASAWIGSSLRDLRKLPRAVREVFGFAIYQAQLGERHVASKTLSGFGGSSVVQIVEDFQGSTFLAVYTVRFAGIIYVLHVFQKKSKSGIKTPQHDMELIKRRLKLTAKHYEEWLHESEK